MIEIDTACVPFIVSFELICAETVVMLHKGGSRGGPMGPFFYNPLNLKKTPLNDYYVTFGQLA